MHFLKFNPKEDLIFDLRAVEACRSCKRFNFKASCPPHIPDTSYYQKLLPSYEQGILLYKLFTVLDSWEIEGKKSSLEMAEELIKNRDRLFSEGFVFVSAFGSGSCKICKSCSFPCRFPNSALVPLEATGLNVVKLCEKFNINLKFPIEDSFYRIGAIFYG